MGGAFVSLVRYSARMHFVSSRHRMLIDGEVVVGVAVVGRVAQVNVQARMFVVTVSITFVDADYGATTMGGRGLGA